jgi:hypothetical protein
MASMASAIVAGPGRERTSMLFLTRVDFRRALPLGAGGQGSVARISKSTARRMHERATLRNRPLDDAASCCPLSPRPRRRSTSASVERSRSRRGSDHAANHFSNGSSALTTLPGRIHSFRCARRPTGAGGAMEFTARGTKRAMASTAESRVRGCHSGHCSASHRRAHAYTVTPVSVGRHDSGSPVSSSNCSPRCCACARSMRTRSASALVANVRLRCRPSTAHRTTQGRLFFWVCGRFCSPKTCTSCSRCASTLPPLRCPEWALTGRYVDHGRRKRPDQEEHRAR